MPLFWEWINQIIEKTDDLLAARRADKAYQEWKRDPSTARPYEEIRDELKAEGLLDDDEPGDGE